MKLHANSIAAFSRPVVLFIEANDLDVELVHVDIFGGECQSEAFARMNPSRQIPVLEDDGFILTECASILRYLASKFDSPAYPKDLRQRARVDEAMDWMNTGFSRDFQYNFIYPQILDNHKRPSSEVHQGTVMWGQEQSRKWMQVLENKWLATPYFCGDRITIADYFATGGLLVGELIELDLGQYPNVARWLQGMKNLPGWSKVDYAANGLVDAMRGPDYVGLH